MILNVTFDYLAKTRHGRKRNEDDVRLTSVVAVRLDEHDGSDCPLAAWWSPPRSGKAAPRVAVRLVDGAPAEPVCMVGGTVDAGYLDPQGFGEGILKADALAGGFDVTALYDGHLMTDRAPAPGIARADLPHDVRVVRDNEELVAAQVRAMMAGLCLVDGILHRRGWVPALEAEGYERKCRPCRIPPDGRDGLGRDGFLDATRLYRLDRWEDAVAEGAPARAPDPAVPPVVLIPSAFEFDLPAMMARSVARTLARIARDDVRRQGHAIGTLPTPALLAWADVRDLSRADADPGEILDALRAFDALCGPGVRRNFEYEMGELDRCLSRTDEPAREPELADFTL